MSPHEYPRRILLCVTGLSPQIITETLYALAVQQEQAFVPTEIHLITTREGAERAELFLLEGQRHFHGLCRDYDLDAEAIRFDRDTMHIVHRDGETLSDIRSPEDNNLAADMIFRLVRELTEHNDTAIHASIAGGRKTMGFFLGYAMGMFGRMQDRMSHVLVSTPFESHPEFFYPPVEPRVLLTRDQRPIRTDTAQVMLAEIPFVRLRGELEEQVLSETLPFSEVVRVAQEIVGSKRLRIDLDNRKVVIAGQEILLPPAEMAFYTLFAERRKLGLPGFRRKDVPQEAIDRMLQIYLEISGADPDDNPMRNSLREGMNVDYFDQRQSNIKRRFQNVLGDMLVTPYLIGKSASRNGLYSLRLDPDSIEFD